MLRTLHDAQLGLTAGHLGEAAGKLNAMVVDLACAELRPILSHTTPHAMLNCVLRCCRIISGALNLQMKTDKSNAHVGADDFLPTFIWVVLRAKVSELVTSIRCVGAACATDGLTRPCALALLLLEARTAAALLPAVQLKNIVSRALRLLLTHHHSSDVNTT